uniref:replication initiator protein A n=1 Tax=Faecalibacterium sp. TaxID=1971605 RepID=UPI003FED9EC7
MTLDYFYGQAGKLFSFYRIPKALFQEQRFQNLSTDAKTLYGILLDRMSLSVKNEWFDKQGRVFIIFTIEDVKRTLRCADNKATKLLRELENFGLIERKRRGLGKPSLVYVKNFSSDLSNERVQNRENHESGSPKNACQDPPKSRCNKNKKSKTERNNTNPILSDELEKMKNRKLLEEYFSRSLEIDLLLRLYPDDEDALYQIVNLLVDTCATNRKLLHIAGDDKPTEVVRSRFMKLNADHIRFVLKCLAENSSPIRNMK